MELIQFDFIFIFLPWRWSRFLWNGRLVIGEGNESLQASQNLVKFEVGLNIMKCKT
jgi:hypothetical protein